MAAAVEDNWSCFLWRKCTETVFAVQKRKYQIRDFLQLQYVGPAMACFEISLAGS